MKKMKHTNKVAIETGCFMKIPPSMELISIYPPRNCQAGMNIHSGPDPVMEDTIISAASKRRAMSHQRALDARLGTLCFNIENESGAGRTRAEAHGTRLMTLPAGFPRRAHPRRHRQGGRPEDGQTRSSRTGVRQKSIHHHDPSRDRNDDAFDRAG